MIILLIIISAIAIIICAWINRDIGHILMICSEAEDEIRRNELKIAIDQVFFKKYEDT